MKNKLIFMSVIVVSVSMLNFKKQAPVQNEIIPKFALGLPYAIGSLPANCDAIIQGAVSAEPAVGTYVNHVLDHIHGQFYRFNKMESADVEMVFCRLINNLGMNPDLSKLPQSISRTVNGHVTTLDVTTPTEPFATTLGYIAKADIKYDGATFVKLWWAGNSAASKGYLIQDSNPYNTTGEKHLKYAQWNRTTSAQTIKIYSTAFNTSYLTNPNYVNPVDASKPGGDRAHFGRATYDSVTKAVSVQAMEVRQDRNNNNIFSCYKMQIAGTVSGTISGYRPAVGTPDSPADTNKDGTHIDGVSGIVDNVSTADGTGTIISSPAALPQPFDYSCSDINTAGSSGAFVGNHVNFNLTPANVFPN